MGSDRQAVKLLRPKQTGRYREKILQASDESSDGSEEMDLTENLN